MKNNIYMNKKYIPYGNNIIIKKKEEETKNGLVVSKSVHQEEKSIGTIIAVNEKSSLKVGTEVVYDEFAGMIMPYEEDLILLDEEYILCLIK